MHELGEAPRVLLHHNRELIIDDGEPQHFSHVFGIACSEKQQRHFTLQTLTLRRRIRQWQQLHRHL